MPGSNEKKFILFAEMNRLLGEVEKLNEKQNIYFISPLLITNNRNHPQSQSN